MKRSKLLTIIVLCSCNLVINAQIGYQVSLLNSATGEPRANETVSVEVEITNSENTVICSETKSATTNEFGVLSLQVGNDTTFRNADWSKLPLYVSATVDGIMVGKSQILNVPVAEAAKTLVNIAPELICGKTWISQQSVAGKFKLILNQDNTFNYYAWVEKGDDSYWHLYASGIFIVQGEEILLCNTSNNQGAGLPTSVVYYNGHLYGSLGAYCTLTFNISTL